MREGPSNPLGWATFVLSYYRQAGRTHSKIVFKCLPAPTGVDQGNIRLWEVRCE